MRTFRIRGGKSRRAKTLNLILRLIERGKRDPRIRSFTNKIIRKAPEGDVIQEILRVAAWIKKNIRYSRDPVGVETVADAIDTIRLGYGDCDDLAVLSGAMFESIGHPVRIRPVGEQSFSHIFLEVYEKRSGWIPVDFARNEDQVFKERVYPLEFRVNMDGTLE